MDESEGKEGSPPARLLRVLEQRAGSGHELVQAFAATCRALGLPARYVCPLDPRSYQNPPYLKLRKKTTLKCVAFPSLCVALRCVASLFFKGALSFPSWRWMDGLVWFD